MVVKINQQPSPSAIDCNMNYIEISGVDLVKLLQRAYDLPPPHHSHKTLSPAVLDEASAVGIITKCPSYGNTVALSVGVLNHRPVMLLVFRRDDRLFMRSSWEYHSDQELQSLLEGVGLTDAKMFESLDKINE